MKNVIMGNMVIVTNQKYNSLIKQSNRFFHKSVYIIIIPHIISLRFKTFYVIFCLVNLIEMKGVD